MSELNPYESPASGSFQPGRRDGPLLRIGAIIIWLIAGLLVCGSFLAFGTKDMAEQFEAHPPLFLFLSVVAIFLPIVGILSFGFSLWRRSKRMAIVGTALFLPLILTIAWLMARDAMR